MNKRRKRRQYTTAQKTAILKRHLVDKMPVSELCEEYDIQPSVFYGWQRTLVENISAALDAGNGHRRRRQDSEAERLRRENAALKEKLAKKDHVIAEISEEHIALKKELGEL